MVITLLWYFFSLSFIQNNADVDFIYKNALKLAFQYAFMLSDGE